MKKRVMASSSYDENSKFHKNKRFLFLLLIIIILIIVGFIIYNLPKINNFLSGRVVSEEFSVINKENLGNYLEKQNIIKDLPKDAVILVRLYNLNSGSRQLEEEYLIKKSEVRKINSKSADLEEIGNSDNPDIIIYLNSKYVPELKDLCSAIKNAKTNNDLSFESKISNIRFLWKYGGMFKYRRCLGF